MPECQGKDRPALRPAYGRRAGKVVVHSLLLSLVPFVSNLFFQGRREFEKEIALRKQARTLKKKG